MLKISVAKTANSLTAEIHVVIEQIMMGEALAYKAKAVLSYLKAQQDMAEASRRAMVAESQMRSALGWEIAEVKEAR